MTPFSMKICIENSFDIVEWIGMVLHAYSARNIWRVLLENRLTLLQEVHQIIRLLLKDTQLLINEGKLAVLIIGQNVIFSRWILDFQMQLIWSALQRRWKRLLWFHIQVRLILELKACFLLECFIWLLIVQFAK